MQDRDTEASTFQLVIDQVEELVVTIIEELRARPGVALAIGAAVLGALVGSMLATRSSRQRSRAPLRQAGGVGDAADLARLGMRLLQNPIVRTLALGALERQLRRRFPL